MLPLPLLTAVPRVRSMLVFRPLKNTITLTYVISQVINLIKLTNLG